MLIERVPCLLGTRTRVRINHHRGRPFCRVPPQSGETAVALGRTVKNGRVGRKGGEYREDFRWKSFCSFPDRRVVIDFDFAAKGLELYPQRAADGEHDHNRHYEQEPNRQGSSGPLCQKEFDERFHAEVLPKG